MTNTAHKWNFEVKNNKQQNMVHLAHKNSFLWASDGVSIASTLETITIKRDLIIFQESECVIQFNSNLGLVSHLCMYREGLAIRCLLWALKSNSSSTAVIAVMYII